ncbi:hypothetical protein L204_100554 [Cryptococcus depauperatus]|nr:hypothetical protein L204_01514 [Cryptococcus depauperatus CBS 7855]
MDVNANQHFRETPDATHSANNNPQQVGTQQDALDKGVSAALKGFGYTNQNPGMVEKASDAVRSGFKQVTGRDIPIKDNNP